MAGIFGWTPPSWLLGGGVTGPKELLQAGPQQQAAAVKAQVPGVAQAVSVASFLGKLGESQTWVRIGEFTVGAILLTVGVNAFLKSGSGPAPAAKAAGGAKKAAKFGAAVFTDGGSAAAEKAASVAHAARVQRASQQAYHTSYARTAGAAQARAANPAVRQAGSAAKQGVKTAAKSIPNGGQYR